MKYAAFSRRTFIRKLACAPILTAGGGLLLAACGSGQTEKNQQETEAVSDPCSDLSGISAEEIQKRESLGYVEETPIPDNRCNNCNLYLPPGENQACGGCMLFKGPVYAEAYCTYWAPKVS